MDILALIVDLGLLKPKMVKILTALAEANRPLSSFELEQLTDMSQPDVSSNTKKLIKMGFLKTKEVKSRNKGRPYKIYYLSKPLEEIIMDLIKQKRQEIDTITKKLDEIEKQITRKT